MKSLTALLGIALCLAVIGPSYGKPSSSSEQHMHQNENQIRHRPKRQYRGYYGHHSQWPEQYQLRDDLGSLAHISRLLEDISDFLRRPPPPPPQPIYIPYPVPYPGPQYCQCSRGSQSNQTPNVTSRWPDMEDKRQNWGYDDSEEQEENYGVNARPITFDRFPPPSSTARTPPTVDHGINQAAQSSRVDSTRRLQRCDAVALSCCNPQESRKAHHKCFTLSGCVDYFEKQDVCTTEHVQEVIDLYTAAYSPRRN